MAEDETTRAELVPDPASIASRAHRISDAINDLRNRIHGRGVEPIGPSELADEISHAQEEWQEVRASLLTGLERGGRVVDDWYDTARTLEAWERKVNEIADRAIEHKLADASARIPVTHTVQTASEAVELVERRVKSGIKTVLIGGLAVLAGLWLIERVKK